VTYHGRGQLVGYPLLPVAPGGIYRKTQADASGDGESLPKADYIGYLRRLEQMLIAALAQMGVTAVQIPGKSGVWVQPEALMRNRNGAAEQPGLPAKIAAIGVKVDARGISRHGFALNVQAEAEYWAGIIACGLAGYSITSLGELRKPLPLMQEVEDKILSAFQQVFGYEIVEAEAEEIFSEIELVEKTQSEPAHHP
jgi:lipoate-protein ligase B